MAAEKTHKSAEDQFRTMSVWGYFKTEMTRGYQLEREEEKYAQKRQRVYTFMKTPRELEKFTIFGFFQCLDAFLFIFTFLPLRILLAVLRVFTLPCGLIRSRSYLEPAQICDILKGVVLVVCSFIVSHVDTSMMYHLVRGQATIKLYVFFNMLDMADRLLSTVGHDILDALFWTATEPRGRRREHFGTLAHLVIAIVYVIAHTLLILFQATVLNVAFNSHNKSLLVIMMSNNFVEIKSHLFKKVDINHLYQIACSDVKERFHYVVLLSLVCIRNMNAVAWDLEHLWVLLPDAIIVLISEVLVDWGKHAFVLKFNEILADVYGEFKVKLALDMASSRQSQAFTDHSDLVSRRMGLTPLPLACLLYLIVSRSVRLTTTMDYTILALLYLCLMSFKVLNSIILLGHSYHIIEKYHQENEADSDSQTQENTAKKERSHSPEQKNGVSPEPENIPQERRASGGDITVPKNFSQIFSADSYTELTLITDTTAIEPTGGFNMRVPHARQEASSVVSDGEMSEQELESHDHLVVSHDQKPASHDHDNVSHDQTLVSHDYEESKSMDYSGSFSDSEVKGNKSSNNSSSKHSESLIPRRHAASRDLHGASLFQRSNRSFMMSFGARKKFGSSASLPETVGIPEDNESENVNDADQVSRKSLERDESVTSDCGAEKDGKIE
ncbi:transmembrane anterior posterior transformation protein 1 homolog isoform X1 [Mya arenaria]|uniref:transmembrane anterior posterior transformation protein 1 homolog isoform X1 n=2 Tax=Mya arenaria TaxID=6604 RepID=UPI0022DEEBAA|nr:transmembrane anterior posterior transformation protein 1 homolog isoform X1 [Mya arenaria]